MRRKEKKSQLLTVEPPVGAAGIGENRRKRLGRRFEEKRGRKKTDNWEGKEGTQIPGVCVRFTDLPRGREKGGG